MENLLSSGKILCEKYTLSYNFIRYKVFTAADNSFQLKLRQDFNKETKRYMLEIYLFASRFLLWLKIFFAYTSLEKQKKVCDTMTDSSK